MEIEHLDVIGATEEMMGLMVGWKHDCTAEPLGTGKFLLPGPMQTCLVQNSGTGSTGHGREQRFWQHEACEVPQTGCSCYGTKGHPWAWLSTSAHASAWEHF